jgi:hypothetical protein
VPPRGFAPRSGHQGARWAFVMGAPVSKADYRFTLREVVTNVEHAVKEIERIASWQPLLESDFRVFDDESRRLYELHVRLRALLPPGWCSQK